MEFVLSMAPGLGRKLGVWLMCGLLWSASALAGVAPEQAELIMKRSGLWDQLGSVLPQARIGFSAAFAMGDGEPEAAITDKLEEALVQAYGAERLRTLGRTRLSRELDARQVTAMQRWFDSPLGRKVDELEKAAAATQTDLRQVIQQGEDAAAHLSAERRALLTQLLQETRSDEAMVDVSLHTVVATHKGISSAMPGTSRLTNKEVKATLMADRGEMLQAYRKLIIASFVQAYAPLSDAELRQYVGFLKTPAGRRHTRLSHQTLKAALDDGASVFVRAAPAVMRSLPPPAAAK